MAYLRVERDENTALLREGLSACNGRLLDVEQVLLDWKADFSG